MPVSRSTNSSNNVRFFFQNTSIRLENRRGLKRFIDGIFRANKLKLDSINYIFCTDKALLAINRQFLSHDFYTDIITFDLSEGHLVTAEVYISTDRVRENAKTLGSSIKSELHRVIFHGALHLCGFKDKTRREQKIMRQKEDDLLQSYF